MGSILYYFYVFAKLLFESRRIMEFWKKSPIDILPYNQYKYTGSN